MHEVRGPRPCIEALVAIEALLLVVHFLVVCDEVRLERVAELCRGIQGDRHQVGVQSEEGEEISQPFRQDDVRHVQVPEAFELLLVHQVEAVAQQGENGLRSQDDNHGCVRDPLQVGHLERGRTRVPDHARVGACVHHDADALGRVPQHGAPEQQLLRAKRLFVDARCPRVYGKGAAESVDVGAGLLRLHAAAELAEMVERVLLQKQLRRTGGVLQLQVGLPIEVRRRDVAVAAVARAIQWHHISRKLLILGHEQHVTDGQVRPSLRARSAAFYDHRRLGGIDLVVGLLAPKVVQQGHGAGDRHHHDQQPER
mmetsp:Transcript_63468/g.163335  ORF Transcript_63468/g.163335 Transcript_63468/m.163335 type:complete len:312 (+) Transcript_63468:3318-4253(+)